MSHLNLNFGNIKQNYLLDLLKQGRSEVREAVKTVVSALTAEQTLSKLGQIMKDFSSGNANLEATLSELETLGITPQVTVEGAKTVLSFEYNGKNYTIQYITPEPVAEPEKEPETEPEVPSSNIEAPVINYVKSENTQNTTEIVDYADIALSQGLNMLNQEQLNIMPENTYNEMDLSEFRHVAFDSDGNFYDFNKETNQFELRTPESVRTMMLGDNSSQFDIGDIMATINREAYISSNKNSETEEPETVADTTETETTEEVIEEPNKSNIRWYGNWDDEDSAAVNTDNGFSQRVKDISGREYTSNYNDTFFENDMHLLKTEGFEFQSYEDKGDVIELHFWQGNYGLSVTVSKANQNIMSIIEDSGWLAETEDVTESITNSEKLDADIIADMLKEPIQNVTNETEILFQNIINILTEDAQLNSIEKENLYNNICKLAETMQASMGYSLEEVVNTQLFNIACGIISANKNPKEFISQLGDFLKTIDCRDDNLDLFQAIVDYSEEHLELNTGFITMGIYVSDMQNLSILIDDVSSIIDNNEFINNFERTFVYSLIDSKEEFSEELFINMAKELLEGELNDSITDIIGKEPDDGIINYLASSLGTSMLTSVLSEYGINIVNGEWKFNGFKLTLNNEMEISASSYKELEDKYIEYINSKNLSIVLTKEELKNVDLLSYNGIKLLNQSIPNEYQIQYSENLYEDFINSTMSDIMLKYADKYLSAPCMSRGIQESNNDNDTQTHSKSKFQENVDLLKSSFNEPKKYFRAASNVAKICATEEFAKSLEINLYKPCAAITHSLTICQKIETSINELKDKKYIKSVHSSGEAGLAGINLTTTIGSFVEKTGCTLDKVSSVLKKYYVANGLAIGGIVLVDILADSLLGSNELSITDDIINFTYLLLVKNPTISISDFALTGILKLCGKGDELGNDSVMKFIMKGIRQQLYDYAKRFENNGIQERKENTPPAPKGYYIPDSMLKEFENELKQKGIKEGSDLWNIIWSDIENYGIITNNNLNRLSEEELALITGIMEQIDNNIYLYYTINDNGEIDFTLQFKGKIFNSKEELDKYRAEHGYFEQSDVILQLPANATDEQKDAIKLAAASEISESLLVNDITILGDSSNINNPNVFLGVPAEGCANELRQLAQALVEKGEYNSITEAQIAIGNLLGISDKSVITANDVETIRQYFNIKSDMSGANTSIICTSDTTNGTGYSISESAREQLASQIEKFNYQYAKELAEAIRQGFVPQGLLNNIDSALADIFNQMKEMKTLPEANSDNEFNGFMLLNGGGDMLRQIVQQLTLTGLASEKMITDYLSQVLSLEAGTGVMLSKEDIQALINEYADPQVVTQYFIDQAQNLMIKNQYQLQNLKSELSTIQNDNTLSEQEKRNKIKDLEEEINKTSKMIDEVLKKYIIRASYQHICDVICQTMDANGMTEFLKTHDSAVFKQMNFADMAQQCWDMYEQDEASGMNFMQCMLRMQDRMEIMSKMYNNVITMDEWDDYIDDLNNLKTYDWLADSYDWSFLDVGSQPSEYVYNSYEDWCRYEWGVSNNSRYGNLGIEANWYGYMLAHAQYMGTNACGQQYWSFNGIEITIEEFERLETEAGIEAQRVQCEIQEAQLAYYSAVMNEGANSEAARNAMNKLNQLNEYWYSASGQTTISHIWR